jgi:frataxin-like iron-binding protein CyaY
MPQAEQLSTLIAIIFGYKRIPMSVIQRKFLLGYGQVLSLIALLEQAGIIETLNEGERVINWQHPDWQIIANQPKLWQPWADSAAAGVYKVEKHEGQWYVVREVHANKELVACVDNEDDGLRWLMEKFNVV